MYCPNCNAENLEGAVFCVNCGAKLDSGVANDNANQSYNQSYDRNQPYQQPGYAQQTNYVQQPNYVQQTNYAQQPNYTQKPVAPVQDEHMSVGAWVGVFCINLIPCVGSLVYIIMMFVWAFGNTPKKSLKNFAKAQLLIMAVLLVLSAIIAAIVVASGVNIVGKSNSYYYH